jgi:soluble lytic murein transglycosylase-like protein
VPGSCVPAAPARTARTRKGPDIQPALRWSPWHQLARPSRAFLTLLAAAGFAGALLVTPSIPRAATESRQVSAYPTVTRSKRVLVPRTSADSMRLEGEVVSRYDHLPLAQILRRTAEPEIANRVARAIVKEARELRLSPSLLAGVLLTENSRLEPETVSSRGAVGLMQVMRFHAGVFDCDSDDLLQVEANICHGARVFAGYLKRTRDVRSALLRYNGCIRSLATRSCKRYPSKVLKQAEEIRQQMLLYLPPARTWRVPGGGELQL